MGAVRSAGVRSPRVLGSATVTAPSWRDPQRLTPMMKQYASVKRKYEDCILFYRLGDFYEMFFEDALTASRELEITLTSRDCGQEMRAPMCGVPFHAVDSYLPRLVSKGYKVAICEQTQEPSQAKGLVERDVVRVATPGTVIEPSMLDEKANAYLMCIWMEEGTASAAGVCAAGVCAADLSTGSVLATSLLYGDIGAKLVDEAAKFMPREIVANSVFFADEALAGQFASRFGAYASRLQDDSFDSDAARARIEAIAPGTAVALDGYAAKAAGALLGYLEDTQKRSFGHVRAVTAYSADACMAIDASTRRHLEITETMRGRSRQGSLLATIDRTVTAAGGRLLRAWFSQPLADILGIEARHTAVGELLDAHIARAGIRERLKGVHDIERLMSRIVMGAAGCRDYLALRESLQRVPGVREIAEGFKSSFIASAAGRLSDMGGAVDLIGRAISEDASQSARDGGVIRDGFDEGVDACRAAMRDGKSWLAALEKRERDATGIKSLKIGYNRVFGYYAELPKSAAEQAPARYVRKQTLANGERYIFEELKDLEDQILGAEARCQELERRLFQEVRDEVASQCDAALAAAEGLAMLDVVSSLAEVAHQDGYCRPSMNRDGSIHIREGRHPVVERSLGRSRFVPNDADMDLDGRRVSIVTGPNMAGKSTYMRQVALICLMAQAGSFVPAESASLCVVDRIFTRVGASDDLAAGQSTFMAEMSELSNILANATSRSLIVLDEIGRGTSTFDGLSIAWAVAEFVNDKKRIGAKTLFSTHYHELTSLSEKLQGVRNYCVAVEESGGEVRFLHKIRPGAADGSYGVHVAKLAGLPEWVTDRAKEILAELEEADIGKRASRVRRAPAHVEGQFNFLEAVDATRGEREVVEELRTMELSGVTPLDAINRLYEWQKKLRMG